MKSVRSYYPVITAIISSFVSLFFLKELFQYFFAFVLGTENLAVSFTITSFNTYFEPAVSTGFYEYMLLYFSPLIFVVLISETAVTLLKKFPLGPVRHNLLIFTLIHLGYLIIYIFYSGFVLILNFNSTNELWVLANHLGFGEIKRIIFAFFLIFIIIIYMNISSRRLLKYINL